MTTCAPYEGYGLVIFVLGRIHSHVDIPFEIVGDIPLLPGVHRNIVFFNENSRSCSKYTFLNVDSMRSLHDEIIDGEKGHSGVDLNLVPGVA